MLNKIVDIIDPLYYQEDGYGNTNINTYIEMPIEEPTTAYFYCFNSEFTISGIEIQVYTEDDEVFKFTTDKHLIAVELPVGYNVVFILPLCDELTKDTVSIFRRTLSLEAFTSTKKITDYKEIYTALDNKEVVDDKFYITYDTVLHYKVLGTKPITDCDLQADTNITFNGIYPPDNDRNNVHLMQLINYTPTDLIFVNKNYDMTVNKRFVLGVSNNDIDNYSPFTIRCAEVYKPTSLALPSKSTFNIINPIERRNLTLYAYNNNTNYVNYVMILSFTYEGDSNSIQDEVDKWLLSSGGNEGQTMQDKLAFETYIINTARKRRKSI